MGNKFTYISLFDWLNMHYQHLLSNYENWSMTFAFSLKNKSGPDVQKVELQNGDQKCVILSNYVTCNSEDHKEHSNVYTKLVTVICNTRWMCNEWLEESSKNVINQKCLRTTELLPETRSPNSKNPAKKSMSKYRRRLWKMHVQ